MKFKSSGIFGSEEIDTGDAPQWAVEYQPSAQKCPVCYGKGIVPNGFYRSTGETWTSSSITPESCRSCKGEGVVWR